MSFLRTYKLLCGKPGKPGFETSDLHIAFSVSRTEDKTGNSATLDVWNLNPEHEALLCEQDCFVQMQAGYKDTPLITIFAGYVTYGNAEKDGADWRTSLELVDGRVEVRDTYVSKSYSGSANQKKIIDDIAAEMKVSVVYADGVQFGEIPNGYSFAGQGAASLDKACAINGLGWYIDKGVLHVKPKNGTMNRQVYELAPDSGLIGFPKKITESGVSSESKSVTGYEVQFFLNGDVKPGDYVYLNTKKIKGFFRVKDIKIDGDSHGGDWLCTATLMVEK